jgi:hypothetical protein
MTTGYAGLEELLPAIAREGDEVERVRIWKASEAAWHDAGMVHLFLRICRGLCMFYSAHPVDVPRIRA